MLLPLVLAFVAAGDIVSVKTKTKAFANQGVPSITVTVHKAITGGQLTLKRQDGKKFSFDIPPKKGDHTFELPQPPGTSLDYEGELKVKVGLEEGAMPIAFKGEVIYPLELQVGAAEKDIAARRFTVKSSREIERVDMVFTGEMGLPLGRQSHQPKAPSTSFVVEWAPTQGPIVRIDASFADTRGTSQSLQLFPWRVEVEHDDVNFATNKWDIPRAEEAKLAAAYERIVTAAKKAMDLAPVKLYVVGHTDTVGATDKNLTLSHKRAKSIAQWFKKHGFGLPVRCAGLGESSLLEPTPDETDNEKNRRAQYVLAVDPPDVGQSVRWEGL